jgi:hypothetical protein
MKIAVQSLSPILPIRAFLFSTGKFVNATKLKVPPFVFKDSSIAKITEDKAEDREPNKMTR